jgi:hypothetical protein
MWETCTLVNDLRHKFNRGNLHIGEDQPQDKLNGKNLQTHEYELLHKSQQSNLYRVMNLNCNINLRERSTHLWKQSVPQTSNNELTQSQQTKLTRL